MKTNCTLSLNGVMAGLVPAIHVLIPRVKKDVDARAKRGHDEGKTTIGGDNK